MNKVSFKHDAIPWILVRQLFWISTGKNVANQCALTLLWTCSSYPHGGWVLSGLIVCCIAALSATMWGLSSCRFLFVDFQSDRGDFGQFYLDPTSNGAAVKYRAGAGLFTWLVPFESTDWSQGRCAGYTELQQETFNDDMFEVARIFAVLSVLGGIGMTSWTLFLSCLSLRKLQIWSMSFGFFLLTCFVAFTFLLFQSALCNDLVSYQNENYTTECTLDQGGLIAVAGSILWFVSFLITCVYIKSPESDMTILPDGQIANAFELRQLERERVKKEKQRIRSKMLEQQQVECGDKPGTSHSRSHSLTEDHGDVQSTKLSAQPSIDCNDDGATEVQLGNH